MNDKLCLDIASSKAISSSAPLELDQQYRVTMQGTFSVWSGIRRTDEKSGPPEPAPMFPSPGKSQTNVGLDPEFIFAWPAGNRLSRESSEPDPRRKSNVHVSLDGGKSWAHPACTDEFNAEHKYTYLVTGAGHPLQVRFKDSRYGDNCGQVKIELEPADATPENLAKIEGIGPNGFALGQDFATISIASWMSFRVSAMKRFLPRYCSSRGPKQRQWTDSAS